MLWVVLNWRNVMVSLYDTFMQIIKMFSSLDKLEKDAFLYGSSSIDTGLKEGCLGWISASSFLLSCMFFYSVQNTQLNTAALVESKNLKAFASSQTQTFWGKFWKIIVSSIQPLGSLSWAKITLKTDFMIGMLILLFVLWRIKTAPLSQEAKHNLKWSIIEALIWLINLLRK